ncbi:MAG: hypothetical protein F2839_00995 [Actinobacteria bacterium]|uniref:Unannotated protein n=1 Tax=freshwater metagenome TaxID=449393 RepID=A0A6J5YTE6_9ZZZZ|nr:hypothetical protein [Actinomycetota bacterium]
MADDQPTTVRTKGWTYPGVFVVSLVLFLIIMGVEMVFYNKFSLFSNIGIILVSTIAAFKVRLNDASAAIWAPAIVWVIAIMTVGQFRRSPDEFTLRNEIFHFGYGLANHAVWIVAATFLSWLIVIVRRGRRKVATS